MININKKFSLREILSLSIGLIIIIYLVSFTFIMQNKSGESSDINYKEKDISQEEKFSDENKIVSSEKNESPREIVGEIMEIACLPALKDTLLKECIKGIHSLISEGFYYIINQPDLLLRYEMGEYVNISGTITNNIPNEISSSVNRNYVKGINITKIQREAEGLGEYVQNGFSREICASNRAVFSSENSDCSHPIDEIILFKESDWRRYLDVNKDKLFSRFNVKEDPKEFCEHQYGIITCGEFPIPSSFGHCQTYINTDTDTPSVIMLNKFIYFTSFYSLYRNCFEGYVIGFYDLEKKSFDILENEISPGIPSLKPVITSDGDYLIVFFQETAKTEINGLLAEEMKIYLNNRRIDKAVSEKDWDDLIKEKDFGKLKDKIKDRELLYKIKSFIENLWVSEFYNIKLYGKYLCLGAHIHEDIRSVRRVNDVFITESENCDRPGKMNIIFTADEWKNFYYSHKNLHVPFPENQIYLPVVSTTIISAAILNDEIYFVSRLSPDGQYLEVEDPTQFFQYRYIVGIYNLSKKTFSILPNSFDDKFAALFFVSTSAGDYLIVFDSGDGKLTIRKIIPDDKIIYKSMPIEDLLQNGKFDDAELLIKIKSLLKPRPWILKQQKLETKNE